MARSIVNEFIKQFSRDKDLKNPFAVGMKMILTVGETSLTSSTSEGVKKSLSYLIKYLNCTNILIFDKHKNLSIAYKKCSKDISDYLKSILRSYIIGSSNREFVSTFKKREKTKFNVFEVDTEKNSYYIVFINVKISREEKTDEFISIIKTALYIVLTTAEKNEYDPLTGVKNRRMYNQMLDSLKNESKQVLYVIMDLYRLKVINDDYGHSKGDLYIKQAAKAMEKAFPGCVYRIGGDEFTVITFNRNNVESKMCTVNKNLSSKLKKMISENEDFYINYGYIIESPKTMSPDEFYNKADQLLYESKRITYRAFNSHDRRNEPE